MLRKILFLILGIALLFVASVAAGTAWQRMRNVTPTYTPSGVNVQAQVAPLLKPTTLPTYVLTDTPYLPDAATSERHNGCHTYYSLLGGADEHIVDFCGPTEPAYVKLIKHVRDIVTAVFTPTSTNLPTETPTDTPQPTPTCDDIACDCERNGDCDPDNPCQQGCPEGTPTKRTPPPPPTEPTKTPDPEPWTPTPKVTETPRPPTATPTEKPHCDNGAGNGDDCTPGNSSGSNQGNGVPTGDQTNQGENGHNGRGQGGQ